MQLGEIVATAAARVSFRDWRWRYRIEPGGNDCWIQIAFQAKCPMSGTYGERLGRKWRLSHHMTLSEVVQTMLKAALAAVEHEAREEFTYRGKPIFGPHYNVDKLAELCETGAHEEVRQ